MTIDEVIGIGREALGVIILVSAPCLGLSVIVGLLISLFQATTQIQDQTLSFAPKILAVVTALFVFGGWMLRVLTDFAQRIFESLPGLI